MKYKIGDKVKYDGGDWWFYGTVSAVFEHVISPCYRLNVERMEKKSCKFSITQFEFELEPYHLLESGKDKPKWDDFEIDLLKKSYGVLSSEDLSKMLKKSTQAIEDKWIQIKALQPIAEVQEPVKRRRQKKETVLKQEIKTKKEEVAKKPGKKAQKSTISEAWSKYLELYRNGEKSGSLYNWVSINRKMYKSGELSDDKIEKLKEVNFSFDLERKKPEKAGATQKPKKERQKRKRGEAWDMNLEKYRNGEKSNAISTWIALNRKEYISGTLPEKKLDQLMAINFPFETTRKKKTIAGTNGQKSGKKVRQGVRSYNSGVNEVSKNISKANQKQIRLRN